MYKILESDGMGYFNTHTEWLTKEEAENMRDKHAQDFPKSDWIIEPHEEDSPDIQAPSGCGHYYYHETGRVHCLSHCRPMQLDRDQA